MNYAPSSEKMQAENPKLKAALVKARLADETETQEDYRKALELYKDAVAILIPLIDGMTYVMSWLIHCLKILCHSPCTLGAIGKYTFEVGAQHTRLATQELAKRILNLGKFSEE